MTAMLRRQILAVVGIEMQKRFLGRRAWMLYLLALGPIVLMGTRAVFLLLTGGQDSVASDMVGFAAVYRVLVLRLAVFFGCVTVFTGLVRGEMLDRTLHYYFLTPMPRWAVTVGKFISGVMATSILFGMSAAWSWILLLAPHGRDEVLRQLGSTAGLGQLSAYVGVTCLGCLGYGAVFLACGVIFRTPVAPALFVLVWENIIIFLPNVLKKISVIHYLESLCPVSLPTDGSIQILSDPSSPLVAIPGILLVSAGFLALAIRKATTMEVLYGAE